MTYQKSKDDILQISGQLKSISRLCSICIRLLFYSNTLGISAVFAVHTFVDKIIAKLISY